MAKEIFKEKYRFSDLPSLVLVSVLCTLALVGGGISLLQPTPDLGRTVALFVTAGVLGLGIWYLRSLQLKLKITTDKIQFKMDSLRSRKYVIPWKEVETTKVIEHRFVPELGRGKIFFTSKHFVSLDGDKGLSIRTKNGENYFIGCRDVEGLRRALQKAKLL